MRRGARVWRIDRNWPAAAEQIGNPRPDLLVATRLEAVYPGPSADLRGGLDATVVAVDVVQLLQSGRRRR
jgi:hypothetical protein